MKYWLRLVLHLLVLSLAVSCDDHNSAHATGNGSSPQYVSFEELRTPPNLPIKVLTERALRLSVRAKEARARAQCNYTEDFDIASSSKRRLVQLALCAINDCDEAQKLLVDEWASWWDSINVTVPFDERLNVDRFLVYARARLDDKLIATPEIIEFERKLDLKYVAAFLARKTRRKKADGESGKVCIHVEHDSPFYRGGLDAASTFLIELPESGIYSDYICAPVNA